MPDMIVASTTATQEEMDHAVSANWREPFPVKAAEEKPVAEPTEEQVEEVIEETPEVSEEETETATVPEAEEEQETEEQRPQKGKGGFQKKIDKLTRERGTLAAENLELRERLEAIELRLAGKPAVVHEEKPEAKVAGKPTPDQIGTKFKDYEEFNEALITWKAEELVKSTLETRDKEAEEREAREIQETRDAGYREAAKEFAVEMPDFNDAIVEAGKMGMKLPEPIIDLIKELPNGPAVTYYLVKNPDEALAVVEASPAMGFTMIGRISQGLEKPVLEKKPPARKTTSSAPPPAKPVGGHSARSSTPLSEMSTDDFIRTRNAQESDKERRRWS